MRDPACLSNIEVASRGPCAQPCKRAFALVVEEEQCALLCRSHRHAPACCPTPSQRMPPRPLLVTGTGRSGTAFVATVLRQIGLRISHDGAYDRNDSFEDGAVSWPHAFRNCLPAYTFRRRLSGLRRHPGDISRQYLHDQRRFLHVVHLIREPLASINSRFNNASIRSRTWAPTSDCNLALRPDQSLDDRHQKLQLALQHWVLWNSFVEATAQHHVRLEDLDADAVRQVLDMADLRIPAMRRPRWLTAIDAAIESTKASTRAVNSRHTAKATPLTWDALAKVDATFTAMAQATAIRHGYPVPAAERLPALRTCPQQRCRFGSERGRFRLQGSLSNRRLGRGRWSCELG
jgi:hypothetical protein